MGDKRSARTKPNQGGCLVVGARLDDLPHANNPAVQDADDGIALRLAAAEFDVELQGHAALRDAARSDVALARAQAEYIEAPPEPPPPPGSNGAVLTTRESQKDIGTHLLVVGLHISPIADLKDLFAPMHAHHRRIVEWTAT